ncbi:MAG: dipeptide epimerase [SAR202 cluster bacterium]|jgi:L-alanine-DL-glutamate epimerase-like enolase superfamily enzyme|nr:dipeptide epimerase [SAR202 cluster bacterium]|tara:strand:- start:4113 stop:5183 length:1071 start_codon:yes stop_codon:yes gene_type:complete
MKIVEASIWEKDLRLREPFSISFMTFNSVQNIFVRLVLENGICGLGAAAPVEEITGESFQGCVDVLDKHLSNEFVGLDIEDQKSFLKKSKVTFVNNPAALTAVETAYFDAFCTMLGIPLCTYFGKKHESFPTSITLGIEPQDLMIKKAVELKKQGFKVIKAKTGISVEEDIELIKKLREKLGKVMGLRVDANQGYDSVSLKTFFSATEGCNVEIIEQPLPAENIQKMSKLPEKIRKSCMADESLHAPEDANNLVKKPQPFGSFNIKLMKCRGLSSAREIAGIAERANIPLMWGCMLESVISISAALHTALSCQNTKYLDLDGSFDLLDDIAEGGFVLKEGNLLLTSKPGLGVTLKQ